MDDLIKRQDAIDAIVTKAEEVFETKQRGATYPHDDFFQGMAYAEDIIKNLPSAQPEIIRCKDCRYCIPNETFHTHWCRGRQVLLDHFCGYAERRTDEND